MRTRDERGFVTAQALLLIILLLSLMLASVTLAAAQISSTRTGQGVTKSRTASEAVLTLALYDFNSDPSNAFGADGRTDQQRDLEDPAQPGVAMSYATSASARTLTTTATTSKSTVQRTYMLRGVQVASKKDVDGVEAIGIPAGPALAPVQPGVHGLWGSPVSTSSGLSYVSAPVTADLNGDGVAESTGTWAVYGGTANAGTNNARIVRFTDSVTVTGTPMSNSRSSVTAYMDRNVDTSLMQKVVSNAVSCTGTRSLGQSQPYEQPYLCNKGNVTLPAITRSSTGVTTIVVKGDVAIVGNITNLSPTGQIHIYTSGSVSFGGNLTLQRVFIHAPQGNCSASQGARIALTGAIACRLISLPVTSSVSWVRPAEQTAAEPYTIQPTTATPRSVFYTEGSDFRDQWTP